MWELERLDLNSEISRLNAQAAVAEKLKHDLVRRIKMLEFALNQVWFAFNLDFHNRV